MPQHIKQKKQTQTEKVSSENVIIGKVDRKVNLSSKKLVLAFVIGLFLVFILFGSYPLIINKGDKNGAEQTAKNQETSTKASDYILRGNYDFAEKELNSNKEFSESLEGGILKASVKINQKKYQEALNILTPLNQKYPKNRDILWALALSYEMIGDMNSALKYYEDLVSVLDKVDFYPSKQADISVYYNKIEELKKGL